MADISRRLEQLEYYGKEERDKQLKELRTDRKEIKEKIHKCQMEQSQLKINELEAKAIESDKKVENLLGKVYSICG